MRALDVWFKVFDVVLPVVLTVPVWGPLLLVAVLATVWWQCRPPGGQEAVEEERDDVSPPCA